MENSQVKSVFKSGESTTSKEAFTKMWIELINKLEWKYAKVHQVLIA